jgi:sulfate adenylyltransferase subunit 1 (EFTu-like GTPase family)
VQDIYVGDGKRVYAGRVESGCLRAGSRAVFSPSGKKAVVRSVEKWKQPDLTVASAGECVGVTFTEELFVERGEVLSEEGEASLAAREISASLFWLGNEPLRLSARYVLKLATAEVEAVLSAIMERIDSSTLEVTERHANRVENLEVANVTFTLQHPIAADTFKENPRLGRFVVEVGEFVAGGGIVREVRSDRLGGGTRVVRLHARMMTDPDGNFIDLSQEAGPVEFEVSPGFVARLGEGEKVAIRLCTADQLERISRLAFGYGLGMTFRRGSEGNRVVLFREGPVSQAATEEGFPVI